MKCHPSLGKGINNLAVRVSRQIGRLQPKFNHRSGEVAFGGHRRPSASAALGGGQKVQGVEPLTGIVEDEVDLQLRRRLLR